MDAISDPIYNQDSGWVVNTNGVFFKSCTLEQHWAKPAMLAGKSNEGYPFTAWWIQSFSADGLSWVRTHNLKYRSQAL